LPSTNHPLSIINYQWFWSSAMSIGPLGGFVGNVAGAPLAQSKGSEVERAHQEQGAQQRQLQNEARAEAAAGVGETDGQDHETAGRDADGRRLWERATGKKEPSASSAAPAPPSGSKDTTGQSGTQLDLSG
jgi:hypothetical protein